MAKAQTSGGYKMKPPSKRPSGDLPPIKPGKGQGTGAPGNGKGQGAARRQGNRIAKMAKASGQLGGMKNVGRAARNLVRNGGNPGNARQAKVKAAAGMNAVPRPKPPVMYPGGNPNGPPIAANPGGAIAPKPVVRPTGARQTSTGLPPGAQAATAPKVKRPRNY